MFFFEIVLAILLGICLVLLFVFFVKEYVKLEKREIHRDDTQLDILCNLVEIKKLLKKYDDNPESEYDDNPGGE